MIERLTLESADGARAHIHAHGAHLTRWWPAGSAESRLFLSERAVFAPGVAIRGGVPVIFPQFAGLGPLPKHGFARLRPWRLEHEGAGPDGATMARYALTDDEATRALWRHAFRATLTVQIGGTALAVTLAIENTDDTPFSFTAALHSYLAVQDIAAVALHGLQGLHYRDTADGGTLKQEAAAAVQIQGEVDRNYFATPPALTLDDGAGRLRIEQRGFADTVVWNPGAAASTGFNDLAAEDYRRFVCIEAAAIQRPVDLAPGEAWQGTQTLTVL